MCVVDLIVITAAEAAREVAARVDDKLSYLDNIRLREVSGEQEMEDELVVDNDNNRTCLGVAGESASRRLPMVL